MALYAVPLDHGDKKEYLRIRRDLEGIGKAGLSVGYELPDIALTRRLFRDILGKSPRGLEETIISMLNEIGVRDSFLENLVCNMEELDRARKVGLVGQIVPIDIAHGLSESSSTRDAHFLERYDYEAQLGEMLYDAIIGQASFRKVVQILKADLLANNDAWKLRNMEMKKHIVELLAAGSGNSDVVTMMGAEHLPWMDRNLKREHIDMKALEDPKEVAGIWWTNYTACEEARRLRDTNIAGLELAKLAVLLSMRTMKTYRGGSELTDDEVKVVRNITNAKDAAEEYKRVQHSYRAGFYDKVLLLDVKRD